MPDDLDQLAQDTDHQDRWGMAPTGRGLQDLAGQQAMTHRPEQPNPAAPYVQGVRDLATRTFVAPLQATGFLPQAQTPAWYDQARETGGQLFREGPAPFVAGMFPRGGLGQVASRAGYLPDWMNDNPLAHALRSPAFTQATQFFTPLVGILKLAVPSKSSPFTSTWGGTHYEVIHEETGQKRADVWLDYDPTTKNVHLSYGQTTRDFDMKRADPRDARRWGLGSNPDNPLEAAVELQSALPEVFRLFPDMKTVDLTSIGGIRGAHEMGAQLKYEVYKTPEGIMWKRIRNEVTRPSPRGGGGLAETQRQFTDPRAPGDITPIPRPPPLPPRPGAGTSTAWDRYWNSIGRVSQEETDRLYGEYIQSLPPWMPGD